MAGLLNTQYANPQAQILYGAGNSKISDAQIRDFISTPGRTDAEIKSAALANNISSAQISKAMSGHAAYTPAKLDSYLASQGINKGLLNTTTTAAPINIQAAQNAPFQGPLQSGQSAAPAPAPAPPIAQTPIPEPVKFDKTPIPEPVKFDPVKVPEPIQFQSTPIPTPVRNDPIVLDANDTVSGQMASILRDQGNPLNVQAQTFANQETNRRGLLNSSMNTTAALDAMYRNAMPIATQDAGTSFAAKRQNSQQGLQANTFNNELAARIGMSNSGLGLQAGTFNNELASRIGTTNSQLGLQAGTFNNELGSRIGISNSELGSRVGMFDRDLAARVGMFNTGVDKDILINQANLDLNRYIAELDTDSKLKVANIQAMANDSGIVGDIGKTAMTLISQLAANTDLTPAMRDKAASDVMAMADGYASLLGSVTMKKIAPLINFGANNANINTANTGGTNKLPAGEVTTRDDGAVATPGQDGKVGSVGSVVPKEDGIGYTVYMAKPGSDRKPIAVDTANFKLSAYEVMNVTAYNDRQGLKINLNDIVPQEFVDELSRQQNAVGFRENTIDKFAVPVHPPGTMRADSPSYYIWKAALPKYQQPTK
jgi:hypothetical protein